MKTDINALVSPVVARLTPYASARRIASGGQDWLNANESPFVNPAAKDSFNRYPDCQPKALVQGYADYAGVDKQQVLTTRGADEGIELLIRAFCQAGTDSVLICPPTYGMYRVSAETQGVAVTEVPLLADFSLDIGAIAEAMAVPCPPKLVFLCSPNNPTGTRLASAEVQAVLRATAGKALVVLDEAYMEFSPDDSFAAALSQYDNLVILRTLSKAFALAGIRCGFALGSTTIIQQLLKVIAPYPVPAPVAQIAERALDAKGINWMQERVEALNQARTKLAEALARLPALEAVGGDNGNFLLYRCPQADALVEQLARQGILVRNQSKQIGLDQCVRFSIGTPLQNQRLIEALTRFYGN